MYWNEPALAPDVELEVALVVIDTTVKLSAVVVLPAYVTELAVEIPPEANRFG